MSTGFGGAFEAIFGLRDGASDSLNRIRSNAVGLSTDVANLSQQVVNFTNNLRAIRADVPIGSPRTRARLIDIERALLRMGQTGNVTAGALQRVTNELRVLATRSTGPQLQAALNQTADEMADLTAQLRLAETDARRTGNSFAFMGDVSQEAAQRFRLMSSASQGALLGLAALDGNVQNLAFSLIFLQFAGFTQLALAAAVAAVGIGLVSNKVQDFLTHRRELEQLSTTFFIITRNIQSMELAQERAESVARQLGLTTKQEEELVRGLVQAQLQLRDRGIEPTADALRVFIAAFLQGQAVGQDFETTMQESLEAVVSFSEGVIITFRGLHLDFEELQRRGNNALELLTGASTDAERDIIAAFKAIGEDVPPDIRAALQEIEGDWDNSLEFLEGRVDLSTLTLLKTYQDNEQGMPAIVGTISEALDSMETKFDETASAVEGRMARMLAQLIIDAERAQRTIQNFTIQPDIPSTVQFPGTTPAIPVNPQPDFPTPPPQFNPFGPGDPERDFPYSVAPPPETFEQTSTGNPITINFNNTTIRDENDFSLIERALIDGIRRGTGANLGFTDVV